MSNDFPDQIWKVSEGSGMELLHPGDVASLVPECMSSCCVLDPARGHLSSTLSHHVTERSRRL